MEIFALTISLLGVIAAIVSAAVAWFARRDSLRAQASAVDAAERAAAAGQRSLQIQESAFNQPPWSLDWWNGDTYLLTNTSSVDAIDVVIQTDPETLHAKIGMTQIPGRIGARSAVKIMHAATMEDPWIRDIVVSWKRDDLSKTFVWRYPMPTRPSQ